MSTVDVDGVTVSGVPKERHHVQRLRLCRHARWRGEPAAISNSTLTGAGAVPVIAQNGIQVGFGAGPVEVTGNTIAGHRYTGNPTNGTGAGILIFSAQNNVIELQRYRRRQQRHRLPGRLVRSLRRRRCAQQRRDLQPSRQPRRVQLRGRRFRRLRSEQRQRQLDRRQRYGHRRCGDPGRQSGRGEQLVGGGRRSERCGRERRDRFGRWCDRQRRLPAIRDGAPDVRGLRKRTPIAPTGSCATAPRRATSERASARPGARPIVPARPTSATPAHARSRSAPASPIRCRTVRRARPASRARSRTVCQAGLCNSGGGGDLDLDGICDADEIAGLSIRRVIVRKGTLPTKDTWQTGRARRDDERRLPRGSAGGRDRAHSLQAEHGRAPFVVNSFPFRTCTVKAGSIRCKDAVTRAASGCASGRRRSSSASPRASERQSITLPTVGDTPLEVSVRPPRAVNTIDRDDDIGGCALKTPTKLFCREAP